MKSKGIFYSSHGLYFEAMPGLDNPSLQFQELLLAITSNLQRNQIGHESNSQEKRETTVSNHPQSPEKKSRDIETKPKKVTDFFPNKSTGAPLCSRCRGRQGSSSGLRSWGTQGCRGGTVADAQLETVGISWGANHGTCGDFMGTSWNMVMWIKRAVFFLPSKMKEYRDLADIWNYGSINDKNWRVPICI